MYKYVVELVWVLGGRRDGLCYGLWAGAPIHLLQAVTADLNHHRNQVRHHDWPAVASAAASTIIGELPFYLYPDSLAEGID